MNVLDRRDATQKTLEWFAPRPFNWAKSATCVHLVRRHLVHMGHKVPPMPQFRSALTAKRALTERGWDTLGAMMDSIVPQIEASRIVVGDVVELPSDNDVFPALCVFTGNGSIMGYQGGVFMVGRIMVTPTAAWRL